MDDDACGASRLQYLVGQPVDDARALRLPPPVRFIPPDPLEESYFPGRLNIFSERGTIIAVTCG